MKEYQGEKAIISLTSWKERINTVSKTLFSLIKQCPGFHIILVLSEEEFPQKEKELPEDLMLFVNNNLIELLWTTVNRSIYKITKEKYKNEMVIVINSDKIILDNSIQKIYENLKNKKRKIQRKILCADVNDEENNGFGLFKHLFENYKENVDVRYITNNIDILKKYPRNAFSWKYKSKLIKWCDTICYSYENFADISKFEKTKIFLQHGITWAKSDKYIKYILNDSTYSTCTTLKELEYFNSLNTNCKNLLTGMAIYDYDFEQNKNENNIVIMFTHRSNGKMPWVQKFLDSNYLKYIAKQLNYKIYFFKHHHSDIKNLKFNVPNYINYSSLSELGNLIRKSKFLITDFSSIAFKAAYLKKSVYYYQPDYDAYSKDPNKPKGWYDWKNDSLGFRSENSDILFKKIINEINNKFKNEYRNDFFLYKDNKNCERICKRILGI